MKRLVKIWSLETYKKWYQIKLVDFLKLIFLTKSNLILGVIKITDDKVHFGMQKHYGTLVISKKSLENFDNRTISIVKNKTNNSEQIITDIDEDEIDELIFEEAALYDMYKENLKMIPRNNNALHNRPQKREYIF